VQNGTITGIGPSSGHGREFTWLDFQFFTDDVVEMVAFGEGGGVYSVVKFCV
jgi:hypothetical protein